MAISKIFTTAIVIFLMCPCLEVRAQQNPEPKRVENISTDKFMEFAPTMSADGNSMIIESNRNSTRRDERWELFESTRNADGSWGEVVPLKAINEKFHFLAGPCLSYDGNRVYFTAFIEGVTTSEDIYYSDRVSKTEWGEAKNLGAPINTEAYEGFPSISADGNSFYFMRANRNELVDKKTFENCFEIYVSHKQPGEEWGEPEKLPDQINMGCVRDPRIMADNHTLIFSAITPTGKGKYDLFQSRRNSDGSWTEARPLDFINSSDNDLSPTIPAAGDTIYFCTKNDIYALPIPEEFRQLINVVVTGYVRSEKNKQPIKTTISALNIDTGEIDITGDNLSDGRFSLVLAAGTRVRVEFFNPYYVKEVLEFDLRKQNTYKAMSADIYLRSDYQGTITAQDRDLKIPVTSFVQVLDRQNNSLWADSLRRGQPGPTLKFETTNQYSITARAANYPDVVQTVSFNAQTFKPDTTFTVWMIREKVKISVDVTDITTKKRVKTKVTYNNLSQDEVIIAEAGESVYLRKGDRYQLVASSDKGYFFSHASIITAGQGDVAGDGSHYQNILLTPIQEGASLTLDNITFETNSAELKTSSYAELDRIIELMHQNPNVIIEIAAHTDDVGSNEYNFKLSRHRAQSVIVYLNKKGIENKRFEAKGFGKSKPMGPNDTEESRALNRRVELTILKTGEQ